MFYALCTQHNIDTIELILNATEKKWYFELNLFNDVAPTKRGRSFENRDT